MTNKQVSHDPEVEFVAVVVMKWRLFGFFFSYSSFMRWTVFTEKNEKSGGDGGTFYFRVEYSDAPGSAFAGSACVFKTVCWRRTSSLWAGAPARGPPASGRRSAGAPWRWEIGGRAVGPESGWSTAASSGRPGCRSRDPWASWSPCSGDSQPVSDQSGRGVLEKK